MTDSRRSGNNSLRSKLRGIKPAVIETIFWQLLTVGSRCVNAFYRRSGPTGGFLGEPFERFELLLRSKDEAAKRVTNSLTLWHPQALSESGQILLPHGGEILRRSP